MQAYVVIRNTNYGDGDITSVEEIFASEYSADKYVAEESCNLNAWQWYEIEEFELKE